MANPGFLPLVSALLLFGFCLWGAGSLVFRDELHSLRTIVGSAIVLFAAGWLVFFGLAGAGAIYLLFGFCFLAGVWVVYREVTSNSVSIPHQFVWVVPVLFVVCLVNTQGVLWPDAYNYHDDFQKYFVHPLKLLQTGSPYGSTVATIGKEVLGGQAFMQAVFVSMFGVGGINLFDANFCLLLSIFLIVELGVVNRRPLLGVLGALTLFTVHQQYVNVSSLYSLTMYMLAAIVLSQRMMAAGNEVALRSWLAMGGVYAAAISLKSLNGLLPLIHFPMVVLACLYLGMRFSTLVPAAIAATMAGLIVISGWAANPLEMFLNVPTSNSFVHGESNFVPEWSKLGVLFRTEESFYGSNFFSYTFSCLVVFFGLAILLWLRSDERINPWPMACLIAGSMLFAFAFLFLMAVSTETPYASKLMQRLTGFRYLIPVLVAVGPLVLMMAATGERHRSGYVAMVAMVVLIMTFAPVRYQKIVQGGECGSVLAFEYACEENFLRFNKFVLGGGAAVHANDWQSSIPRNVPFIAFVDYPFLFDFTRNPVREMDLIGLTNPWATTGDVNHIVIQGNGFASPDMRAVRIYSETEPLFDRQKYVAVLSFVDYIDNKVSREAMLFQDNESTVIRFSHPDGIMPWPAEEAR